MMTHPVRLEVNSPAGRDRIQLAIRLVLLAALSALGCSSVYWIAYLTLPALAALAIARDGAPGYLTKCAPTLVRGLRWLAAAYAYLWLLTDAPPSTSDGPVAFDITIGGNPSPGSALARLIKTLPALVVLVALSLVASVLWLAAAVCVLASQRVPTGLTDFIESTLRYQFRAFAYHLSLVDRYPSVDPSKNSPAPHGGIASTG
jgi:hypothetical protein